MIHLLNFCSKSPTKTSNGMLEVHMRKRFLVNHLNVPKNLLAQTLFFIYKSHHIVTPHDPKYISSKKVNKVLHDLLYAQDQLCRLLTSNRVSQHTCFPWPLDCLVSFSSHWNLPKSEKLGVIGIRLMLQHF